MTPESRGEVLKMDTIHGRAEAAERTAAILTNMEPPISPRKPLL